MIVVLSGEGPTDLGQCTDQQDHCSIPQFSVGPMAVILDQIIETKYGHSLLAITPSCYRYYSERALKQREFVRKQDKRRVSLRGKKRNEETGYFYLNAWMLGDIAKEIEAKEDDMAVAIFFRDSDGTNSSPSNLWQHKWNSITYGFARANFDRGVPMLPRPKSEAWLLCAAKNPPYQFCAALEDLPGNDGSPNSAKSKLETVLKGSTSAKDLVKWLIDVPFDHQATSSNMDSFNQFRTRLLAVLP